MTYRTRAARRFACLVPLALLAAPPVAAAPAKKKPAVVAVPAKAKEPWLYRGSDVPQDKAWVFGELPNGLRYAVRKNGVPPGQVSIRIRMDVGSLHEQDSERGYAHLLEHLVFRQSKYLADGAAIATWQRLGATFGSDTNAQTTPVSTTFKLDLPDATPASLDESFKLLSGMMIAPTLSEHNVRTDVPIVLAEKRERGGVQAMVADATTETLFAGQRLAVRPVIGTDATLNGATEASVRAFHARWYRPENAAIIVAGDADPLALEALVKKWFSDWKVPGAPAAAPPFGDPVAPAGANSANPVGETRVIVEPNLQRGLTWAVLRPWRPVQDRIAYNQGLMVDTLAEWIINRRLEAKARGGASFLGASVGREKVLRSADGTFVTVTPLGEDWRKAAAEVRAVIADALASPPSEEEIEREVAEIRVNFESEVEQSRLQAGGKLADSIVGALDIRETVASPETVLKIFDMSKSLFTPANVYASTRKLFSGAVTRAVYLTPKAGEADAAALRTALVAPIAGDAKARLASKTVSFADLPPLGTPGAPPIATSTGVLAIEQVDLGNGVKAVIWPSKDEPGRLTVKVRFGAGYRAFQDGDAPYIALGELALVNSGVGPLGQEELDRISTGRKMGFDFDIQDASFEFAAATRQADLADQLYLFAAKFAMPRWDANPVQRAKAAAKQQYESYSASPQGLLERDLEYYRRGRDPRFHTPTPAEIDGASVEGFRQVWQPILENGPIEVQIFGDFDRAAALEALRKTFGALPRRTALPASTRPPVVGVPKPSLVPVVLNHKGDPTQAAALVAWPTGGGLTQISESRQLEILTQVFSNRLLERLREKQGASYSPQVFNNWPVDLQNGGAVIALAQLSPGAVKDFYSVVDQIATELTTTPPSADELARVTEPLRQSIARASSSSTFFMGQLEGASETPAKYGALRSILVDYTRTTPEAMLTLARKYLKPDQSWRMAIVPEGTKLAGTPADPGAGR